jgi:leucyl aminopeptidase (aminopeptidase T)
MTCNADLSNEEGVTKPTLDVLISGKDNSVSPFIELVSDYEEAMVKAAKELKSDWFPDKEITDDYIDSAFHASFKPIKKTHDAIMRLRTSKELQIYTSEKEETTSVDIKEGSKIAMIVLMDGVWFSKNRFGITWKVVQMKIHKQKESSKKYMFDDNVEVERELDNVFPEDI